jgi:hypothetical protein
MRTESYGLILFRLCLIWLIFHQFRRLLTSDESYFSRLSHFHHQMFVLAKVILWVLFCSYAGFFASFQLVFQSYLNESFQNDHFPFMFQANFRVLLGDWCFFCLYFFFCSRAFQFIVRSQVRYFASWVTYWFSWLIFWPV